LRDGLKMVHGVLEARGWKGSRQRVRVLRDGGGSRWQGLEMQGLEMAGTETVGAETAGSGDGGERP